MSNYIPDVFLRYQTRNDKVCTELIEIKPKSQSMVTERMKDRDRAIVAINHAKWAAAQSWCKRAGIVFRVITEEQMFRNGGKKR